MAFQAPTIKAPPHRSDEHSQSRFCYAEPPFPILETPSALVHNKARPLRDQIHRKLVNRPFQFQKCSQLSFGSDDETLSVAMRANNPDRSSFKIDS